MARPFRRPFPAAFFHGTVLLVAWSALGTASAAAGDGVDFPGAVAQALRNNAGVSAAGYGWPAAKKDAQAARGNSLPRLAFEERFVRTNMPAEAFAFKLNQERFLASDFADVRNFNEAPPINDYITSFTLEQPIFAPRAYLGYVMARREANATGFDVSRKKEETVFQVLTAYLHVLTAKEYARVAEQGLSDAREHYRNGEAMVSRRKSDYLHTVAVTGAYQIDGQDGIFTPDNHAWRVAVGLSWNLFDGLRREAEVARASAERGKARQYYRGAEDFAAFQVTQSYLQVEEAARRVEIARAAVAAAEEGTRLVRSRYENQLARMIDLLDAQTAQNGARADLVRAQNDLQQSPAQLQYPSRTLFSLSLHESGEPR